MNHSNSRHRFRLLSTRFTWMVYIWLFTGIKKHSSTPSFCYCKVPWYCHSQDPLQLFICVRNAALIGLYVGLMEARGDREQTSVWPGTCLSFVLHNLRKWLQIKNIKKPCIIFTLTIRAVLPRYINHIRWNTAGTCFRCDAFDKQPYIEQRASKKGKTLSWMEKTTWWVFSQWLCLL